MRIYYLDHLKIYLTFMVISHHVAQAYGDTGGAWLVFDSAKADFLGTFMYINASYLMALYFFISGYFTYPSLNKKGTLGFLKDRLVRLGVPCLIFGLCVFVPLHYFLNGSKGSILCAGIIFP
ncbi:acyltransferase family protein [Leadbetterella byssophila]|uniref:acyltransferase family protein n=1 Tax=Leadbetterella byssophila TaxID=316068 RepID=UPI000309763F|nr:acyltransferase family protein [Leadbetterella byssophila]